MIELIGNREYLFQADFEWQRASREACLAIPCLNHSFVSVCTKRSYRDARFALASQTWPVHRLIQRALENAVNSESEHAIVFVRRDTERLGSICVNPFYSYHFFAISNGKPEYAVIPYADYEHLVSVAELVEDMQDYDKVKVQLARGEEELLSAEMTHRLADGESPIRVWREHRSLTVSALAEQAAISQTYLSQIEAGKRKGTIGVFHALTEALKVTIDDLVAYLLDLKDMAPTTQYQSSQKC